MGGRLLIVLDAVLQLIDLGFLLRLVHRLILLRLAWSARLLSRLGSRRFLRLYGRLAGSILLHEHEELMEDLVRQLVDIELELVVLNTLWTARRGLVWEGFSVGRRARGWETPNGGLP